MRPSPMGPKGSDQRVVPVARPTLETVVALSLFGALERLLRWAFGHPLVVGLVVVVALVVHVGGVGAAFGLLATGAVSLAAWRRIGPKSYRRLVVSHWRGTFLYRRHWQPAMVTCGLAVTLEHREYLPLIRGVISTSCVDRVSVQMLAGQSPDEYDARVSQLAHTFGAQRCRVVVDRPGRIWLEFTHRDPLTKVVNALEPQRNVDLTALPVGLREDDARWTVGLLGTHLLIAGATGSGKGSVLWSLVRAMAPTIRDGAVHLWAVDPKGGMELTPGQRLFRRFACESPEVMVSLLEDAVAFMRARALRLREAGARTHVPTADDPLVVVLVDEMAALTAYVGDRDLKRRAESALQLLLSQGRAAGVLVVAAVQDPGKDVIAFRDLFPTRIALRLIEDVQVDMVLGRSARLHGAYCDQIPPSLPGVGYVIREGVREPLRVRAAHVTDADLAQMVIEYAPRPVCSTSPHLALVEGD